MKERGDLWQFLRTPACRRINGSAGRPPPESINITSPLPHVTPQIDTPLPKGAQTINTHGGLSSQPQNKKNRRVMAIFGQPRVLGCY